MAKPPSKRKKATSAASNSELPAISTNGDISQQVDPSSATITVTAVGWRNYAIADYIVRRIRHLRNIAGKDLVIAVASLIF
ncbi:hypothetical protein H6G97_23465 [Nostoc flagelliforme FACHB-838]|uniref:Uncharacterized protein n=1 Tax=Nostoc flagelliforme FACHB-838 TaxID=2692904 RepID=A0ABR8DSP6_9NOSO|nr:hypothetical protein [Nostoc flagelliforme]MBD2532375.1 hypothetical protein [Nostoc flagelliforme FACHB-838]